MIFSPQGRRENRRIFPLFPRGVFESKNQTSFHLSYELSELIAIRRKLPRVLPSDRVGDIDEYSKILAPCRHRNADFYDKRG